MSATHEKSSLALCCHRSVARMQALDDPETSWDLGDDDWAIELALQEEAFSRAISLPSQSLDDIKAKASLALDDLNRFYPASEGRDPGEHLIAVVLGEIIALCA